MPEEKKCSMTERAYTEIKEKIQNCFYMPGESISEKGICDVLACGRTPVREALLALRGEGLVEIFPRKGIRVAGFTPSRISEIYQIRKLLEPAVCVRYALRFDKGSLLAFDRRFRTLDRTDDLAYYRLDTDFHRWLVASANNHTLDTFFAGLMEVQYRFGVYSSRIGTAEKRDYYTEHHEIIEALLSEDTVRIETSVAAHINYSEVIALKTLDQDASEQFGGGSGVPAARCGQLMQ